MLWSLRKVSATLWSLRKLSWVIFYIVKSQENVCYVWSARSSLRKLVLRLLQCEVSGNTFLWLLHCEASDKCPVWSATLWSLRKISCDFYNVKSQDTVCYMLWSLRKSVLCDLLHCEVSGECLLCCEVSGKCPVWSATLWSLRKMSCVICYNVKSQESVCYIVKSQESVLCDLLHCEVSETVTM